MRVKPHIVSEIGINHNGDIDIAKSLITISSNFGASHVKFQKRDIDIVYDKQYLTEPRQSKWGTTQRDQKEGLEFGKDDYGVIDSYCKEQNIPWFASPWDVNSIDFITEYDIPFIKLASASITDMELLDKVKAAGIPVIISTGMSNKSQIDKAVSFLDDSLEYILWCKSTYPCKDEDNNMSCLTTLQEEYGSRARIGFSNHSPKIIYCVQAYIMGAEMIEFHITMDRNMAGSDQNASIGPTGFDRIVKHINSIHTGWGEGKIEIIDSEQQVLKKLRKVQ